MFLHVVTCFRQTTNILLVHQASVSLFHLFRHCWPVHARWWRNKIGGGQPPATHYPGLRALVFKCVHCLHPQESRLLTGPHWCTQHLSALYSFSLVSLLSASITYYRVIHMQHGCNTTSFGYCGRTWYCLPDSCLELIRDYFKVQTRTISGRGRVICSVWVFPNAVKDRVRRKPNNHPSRTRMGKQWRQEAKIIIGWCKSRSGSIQCRELPNSVKTKLMNWGIYLERLCIYKESVAM